MTNARSRLTPHRPGWRATRSNFGSDICPRCLHDMLDHFYWERPGDQELGCHGCADKICEHKQHKLEGATMSALNLCERCDSLMLGKAVGTIRLDTSPSAYSETIELCPKCISDFKDFMHESPSRDQRAFKEPYKEPEENAPKELH